MYFDPRQKCTDTTYRYWTEVHGHYALILGKSAILYINNPVSEGAC